MGCSLSVPLRVLQDTVANLVKISDAHTARLTQVEATMTECHQRVDHMQEKLTIETKDVLHVAKHQMVNTQNQMVDTQNQLVAPHAQLHIANDAWLMTQRERFASQLADVLAETRSMTQTAKINTSHTLAGMLADAQIAKNTTSEALETVQASLADLKRYVLNERRMHDSVLPLGKELHLNVGGEIFFTTQATLASVPSMLATLVTSKHFHRTDATGSSDSGALDDDDNEGKQGHSTIISSKPLFIDRDPRPFRHILAFLRSGSHGVEHLSVQQKHALRIEADFYQLDELLQYLNLTTPPPSEHIPLRLVVKSSSGGTVVEGKLFTSDTPGRTVMHIIGSNMLRNGCSIRILRSSGNSALKFGIMTNDMILQTSILFYMYAGDEWCLSWDAEKYMCMILNRKKHVVTRSDAWNLSNASCVPPFDFALVASVSARATFELID
jgi:hypothetical protein